MRKMNLLASCGLALVLGACATTTEQTELASTATAPAPAAASDPTWAHQASDLSADEDVRFGVLDNGMRYAILKNATPPNEASLRLRIDAGSLDERDDQRGVAHFLEHMVLNGTENVPEGEFIRRLERAGLKFGPDTNASTEFQQTVYKLDLPETDAETVDTALFLLREVADEATLDSAAIDAERGIILSEERTRSVPGYRILVDQLGYLFEGQRLPERLPIGSTDVIRNAPRERFVEFYNGFYRPERATLIAVGDFDVAALEAKIREQFGSWQGEGPAAAEAPAPAIAARGTDTRVFVEPGGPTQVSLNWVSPADLRPDTEAVRTEKLIEQLGLQILSRRFERLATSSTPPFIGGAAVRGSQADQAEIVQVVGVAQAGKWREALATIEQEQRRLAEHGVTQSELDREISEYRAALTAAAAGAATRRSNALAEQLVAAVDTEEVFTDPVDNLARFEEAVKGLRAETVTAATRSLFEGSGPLLYLTSPTPVEAGDATLLAAYSQSQASPVAPPEVQQAQAWPYTSFGAAGTVVERTEIPGIGATAVRFANGTRLTVKPTEFADGEIHVAVRAGDGRLDLPTGRPSPEWAIASGAFTSGGLGKLSFEDVQRTLAARVTAANTGIDDDAFILQGKTRPADFEVQMQLLAAYLTDAGWRAEAWDRLKGFGPTIHTQLAATPGGVFNRDSETLLRSGDSRWAFPSLEQIAASSVADARAMVAPGLAAGPIEVTIVGDVTVEEAIAQTAATFGALPARGPDPAAPAAARIAFPAGTAGTVRRTHKGRPDQGLAFIAWPTTDFYADPRRARALNLLGDVMRLRLLAEIREKQGTTYSPAAAHSASEVFPGYGYLGAQIEAPPEKLDAFLADAREIAASLRTEPVTADELQRARRPRVEGIQRARAGNEWWLANLANVQDDPRYAENLRTMIAEYDAITPAELQRLAQQYLVDPKAWAMVVVPEAK